MGPDPTCHPGNSRPINDRLHFRATPIFVGTPLKLADITVGTPLIRGEDPEEVCAGEVRSSSPANDVAERQRSGLQHSR